MTDKFDPYKVLNIGRNSTDEEISAAYKAASRMYHPDRPGGGDSVKFSQCSDAKTLLLDKQKRNLYDRGGWEAVSRYDQMKQAEQARQMKCEPVNLNLKVSLEQIYRHDSIPIKVDIPGGEEKFQMDLKLDPGMIGHGLCVENRGISRPDCVTGDVIIHVELDSSRTPFKINGLDIIMEIKMQIADLLGFSLQIDHPSGTVYSITGKYENPDENGNMVYYFPTMGLTGGDDTGNMVVCITPDFSTLSKLPKRVVQDIQTLLSQSRKYESSSSKAMDITEKALSARQMRSRMRPMGGPQMMINGMQMPMGMMGGGPQDCKVQ
jgi:DnaJ-class molecular chaperone